MSIWNPNILILLLHSNALESENKMKIDFLVILLDLTVVKNWKYFDNIHIEICQNLPDKSRKDYQFWAQELIGIFRGPWLTKQVILLSLKQI